MSKSLSYGTDKKNREELLRRLSEFSDSTFSADQGVAYHNDPPNKISLPEGMTPEKGSAVLSDVAKALAQEEVFSRTFKFRPWDGAHALTQVMAKHFGTTGRGKPIQTMFGSIPPQQIEIEVGPDQTVQVPWGHINFEQFEGTLMLGGQHDSEFGTLFQLSLECPKRYAAAVTGFFNLIQMELESNSIYKGKSIRMAIDSRTGQRQEKFLKLTQNPTIVYTDEVNQGLTNTVWGVIENADLFKQDHRRVNKRTLLHGPYGTGKSEAGVKTAEVANKEGWTFIQFHSGKGTLEDLEATMATARLYQPSVVFIEDIDVYAGKEGEEYQTRLSNLFDGVGSKGDEVMLVMTSNRAASFSKGMLRAGRVDRMIEVGPLDRAATEELILRVVGKDRLGEPVNGTEVLTAEQAEKVQETEVDYAQVHEAMEGFEPAFVRQTFDQAAEAAIIRTKSLDYVLTTSDFVDAANLLRPQHDMHTNTAEQGKQVTFDSILERLVSSQLAKLQLDVVLNDGDYEGMAHAREITAGNGR